jgi:cell division septal protein FtsQ
MSQDYNQTLKYRGDAILSRPLIFQRGEGAVPIKKTQRKSALRFKHIFLILFLLGGFFYSLYKFTVFLITWDYLSVKTITINSPRLKVQQELQALLQGKKMGNILLLDIARLQSSLENHRWVKDARLRKVFPSALQIDIKEREPKALLKKYSYVLIDEQGVELERLPSRESVDLPLLLDSNGFQKNYQEKLRLAWECLDDLEESERSQIDALDLSDFESVSLMFKNDPTLIILGNSLYSRKLAEYEIWKSKLESRFGPLEYADLRFFEDRVIFKEMKPEAGSPERSQPRAKKEAD